MLDNVLLPLYDAPHVSDTASLGKAADADDATPGIAKGLPVALLGSDVYVTRASALKTMEEDDMKKLLIVATLLGLVGLVWAQDIITRVTLVKPEALMWKDNPAIPKGAQVAVMLGDP